MSRAPDWQAEWEWEKIDFDEDFEGDLTEEAGKRLWVPVEACIQQASAS